MGSASLALRIGKHFEYEVPMMTMRHIRTGLFLGASFSLQAWLGAAGSGCSSTPASHGSSGTSSGQPGATNASGSSSSSSGAGTSGVGSSGTGQQGGGTGTGTGTTAGGSSSSGAAGSGSGTGGSFIDAANTDNNLDAGGVTDAVAPVVMSSVGDAALNLAPSGSDLTGGPMPDPANLKYCTGTSPIHCFFGVQCSGMEFSSCPAGTSPAGAVGNYDVTFEIGGAAAGKTSVEAEMHRPIVPEQDTTAGQTKRYAFSINVRWPEGEPQEDFQHNLAAGSPQYGEQGLDLLFNGPSPVLTSVGFAPAAASDIVLYVAGDSTVCDQYGYPNFAGYGQVLPQIFHLGVSVANYSDSGESSASFVGNQGLWPAIMKVVKPGDVIFIEFGHNDKAITSTAFHTNMTKYVTDAKAAKAIPILLTPIARANGGPAAMQFQSSGGADIPTITKTVGMEQSVPVIDLTTATANWLMQVGANWTMYHAGGTDATHTNAAGAAINVGFIRDAIISQNIAPLVGYLR